MNLKYLLFGVPTIALCIACSSPSSIAPIQPEEPDIPPAPVVEEMLSVKIGCNLTVTEEHDVVGRPITRADDAGSSDDLFAVQVHHVTNDNVSKSIPYAYGVFDDPDKIVFKLNKDQRYKIEFIYYPNAKNIVWKNSDGTYGVPFTDPYTERYKKLNEPIYYTSTQCIGLFKNIYQNSKGYYDKECVRGHTPLYMGLLPEVTINDDSKIDIRLDLALMGIRLNCTNFTKGKLTLVFGHKNNEGTYTGGCEEYVFKPGDETFIKTQIKCWLNNATGLSEYLYYEEYDGITLFYEDDKNTKYLLATKRLMPKSNTIFVFNFDLQERSDGSFGIILPSGDMNEENENFD